MLFRFAVCAFAIDGSFNITTNFMLRIGLENFKSSCAKEPLFQALDAAQGVASSYLVPRSQENFTSVAAKALQKIDVVATVVSDKILAWGALNDSFVFR